jgi:hypothetical protein
MQIFEANHVLAVGKMVVWNEGEVKIGRGGGAASQICQPSFGIHS